MRKLLTVVEEKNQRRQAVLETAYEMFSDMTIDRVSMQSICDEVGLSFATIYRYFDTKLALVVAVGEWKWGELTRVNDRVAYEVRIQGKTAAERLAMYLETYIDLYREHRRLLRFNQFFNVYMSHENVGPEALKPYTDMIEDIARRFHSIYELGERDGTLRTDIPEQEMFSATLHLMLAAATRFAVGLVYQPEGCDPERELELLRDMMLRTYTRPRAV